MKILFLPVNIASLQTVTCNALNRIEDVEAKCLVRELNKYNSISESTVYIPRPEINISGLFSSLIRYYKYRKLIKQWLDWADVLHYVWGPALESGRDLVWVSRMRKPVFVEWVGSDIRNPEILSRINPYYKSVFNEGYEYNEIESSNYKYMVQKLFSKAGAIPTLLPEMTLFLNKDLFPSFLLYPHRLNLADFYPEFPSVSKVKPLIVHSPTVKIGKGSNIIMALIEELKKEYEFDFILLHNRTRNEVLDIMKGADIFIDQIIVGGYGMASCEAMAYGKPVLCYIMDQVFNAGLPTDCPIINSNPDNLKEQLVQLITDPKLRYDKGKSGRAFVEKYNDANKIAYQYMGIYKEAIQKFGVAG